MSVLLVRFSDGQAATAVHKVSFWQTSTTDMMSLDHGEGLREKESG